MNLVNLFSDKSCDKKVTKLGDNISEPPKSVIALSPKIVTNMVTNKMCHQHCHQIDHKIRWITKFITKFVTTFVTKHPGAPIWKRANNAKIKFSFEWYLHSTFAVIYDGSLFQTNSDLHFRTSYSLHNWIENIYSTTTSTTTVSKPMVGKDS